jgi:hypothetical protein
MDPHWECGFGSALTKNAGFLIMFVKKVFSIYAHENVFSSFFAFEYQKNAEFYADFTFRSVETVEKSTQKKSKTFVI